LAQFNANVIRLSFARGQHVAPVAGIYSIYIYAAAAGGDTLADLTTHI